MSCSNAADGPSKAADKTRMLSMFRNIYVHVAAAVWTPNDVNRLECACSDGYDLHSKIKVTHNVTFKVPDNALESEFFCTRSETGNTNRETHICTFNISHDSDPPTTVNLQIKRKHVEATLSSTRRASPGSSLFSGTSSFHPLSSETSVSSDIQTNVGGNPKQIYVTMSSAVPSKDESNTRVVLYSSIGGGGFLLFIIGSIVFMVLFRRKAKRKSLESAQAADALRMRPLPPTPPESRRESMLSTSSDVYQEIKDSDGSESPDDPVDYFHPVASEVNEGKCRTNKMGVEGRNRALAPIRPVRKLGPGKPKFHRLCIPPASLPPDMMKDLDLGLAQRREAVSHIGHCEGLSSEEGAVGGVSLDNVQPLFYASRSCIFPTLPLPGESDPFNDNNRRAHSRRQLAAKSDFHTQASKRRKIRSRERDGRRSPLRSNRTVPYPLCLNEDDLDDIPPLPQRARPILETFDCRAQSSVLPELEISARKSDSSNGLVREPMLLSIPEVTSSTDSDGYMKPRPAAKLAIPGNASVDAAMPQHLNSLPVWITSTPTTRIKSVRPKLMKATQDTATGKAPCFPMTMAASASTMLASSQPENSDYQNLQPSASCTSSRQAPQIGREDDNGGYMCMDKSRGAAKKNIVD